MICLRLLLRYTAAAAPIAPTSSSATARGISRVVDTVPRVYTLTCPECGAKVKVPSGPHSVVATPAAGATRSGITIDGKSVHRCGLDVLVPNP